MDHPSFKRHAVVYGIAYPLDLNTATYPPEDVEFDGYNSQEERDAAWTQWEGATSFKAMLVIELPEEDQ